MSINISIDDFLSLSNMSLGLGPHGSGSSTLLKGISVNRNLPPVPHNTDAQGYVFMTRPGLNLTYDNVANVSKLQFLADDRDDSMPNAIRCLLSPNKFGVNDPNELNVNGGISSFLIRDNYSGLNDDSKALKRSNLINEKSAFLPITNFLTTQGAFPDQVLPTYTSPEGRRGQQISMYDGFSEINGEFDITATFQNIDGDFISSFFGAWISYGDAEVYGTVSPFPVFLLNNELDYTSTIYRIITDRSGIYVQNMAKTGYMMPTQNPDGAKFAYDRKETFTSENDIVSINLHCVGAEKNEPIIREDFNRTVEEFNIDMVKKTSMVKVPRYISGLPFNMLNVLDYNLYPYINLTTNELEWWADSTFYNNIIGYISQLYSKMSSNKASNSHPPLHYETMIKMVLNSKVGTLNSINLLQSTGVNKL